VPLEVRQIGIHMQVGDGVGQDERGDGESQLDLAARGDGKERARLIEQCVEAVLAELARRAER
jgi:hypothetical protein